MTKRGEVPGTSATYCGSEQIAVCHAVFKREQESLDRQAATKTGEAAVAADHAMTGQHDWQRIATIGGTYRARTACGLLDAPRELAVADGDAVGYPSELMPDRKLKRRAQRMQRQIELLPGTAKNIRPSVCARTLSADGRMLPVKLAVSC